MALDTTNTILAYEDMLKAGMHFGRKRTVFHPGMDEFLFTVKDGICIIDLLKTQEKLIAAAEELKTALTSGKLVLFVAATKQAEEGIRAIADEVQMPYVLTRWLGGTLTNFKVINSRVRKLEELEKMAAEGGLEKYAKHEQVRMRRELAKMQDRFGGLKRLTRMPDLVFVASLKEGKLAVSESARMNVPVIAIANTDSNPRDIAVAIPANDRSKISVDLLLNTIREQLLVR
ncbi:MAG: 30S ribosomal protein S2 [Patescibacteria group bacterium]